MIGGKVHPEDTMVQSSRHDHGLEVYKKKTFVASVVSIDTIIFQHVKCLPGTFL